MEKQRLKLINMVKDKIVLVTGGTSGIGFKTAELFGLKKAIVYMNYHKDDAQADKAFKELKENGCNCNLIKADIGSEEAVKNMVSQIIDERGRIDILINNASPKLVLKPFDKLSNGDLENDFNVIVKGTLSTCKTIVPYMRKNQYGRIVNMLSTSILGKVPAHMASYIISKSALFGLTKALAVELSRYNITVNSVSPGFTETELIKDFPYKTFEFYKESLPIKRLATTDDVARVILFLCSESSGYLTGLNIPVCGGGVM